MSEETSVIHRQSSCQPSQKMIMASMNKHVIKLIKHKLIPLNKNRYGHLQKINNAINKGIPNRYNSALKSTYSNLQQTQSVNIENSIIKTHKKSEHQTLSPSFLINRLIDLKDFKLNSRTMIHNQQLAKSWQNLRQSILSTQPLKALNKQAYAMQNKEYIRSSQSRRKRQNLIALAERTENYLRFKKRELKKNYRQKHEDCFQSLQTESQIVKDFYVQKTLSQLLNQYKGSNYSMKQGTNEQLDKQMLDQIRSSLYQQKINRIKREINHKKIVLMR